MPWLNHFRTNTIKNKIIVKYVQVFNYSVAGHVLLLSIHNRVSPNTVKHGFNQVFNYSVAGDGEEAKKKLGTLFSMPKVPYWTCFGMADYSREQPAFHDYYGCLRT